MTVGRPPSPSGLNHPPFAPGGDPHRKLFFFHIHKCAGTSVRAYLESLVKPTEVLPAYLIEEIPDLSVLDSPEVRLVRGHLRVGLSEMFRDPPAVVTTLRDPVARLLSHFEFEKKWRHSYALQTLAPLGDLPLDRALDIPEVRRLLDNRQARALMKRRDRGGSKTSDSSRVPDPIDDVYSLPIDEVVSGAVARLDTMAWIGITEFIDECMPVLAAFVGASPTTDLPVTNVLDVPKLTRMPVWVADVIAELTAADEIVYRHGVEIARRAIAAYRRDEHVRYWSDMLTERAVDLESEVVLCADEPFGGSSWWPAESIAGGSPLRWSGPADFSTIDLPLRVRAGDSIEFRILATIRAEFLAELAVEVNGRAVPTTLDVDGGVTLRGVLPAGVEGPWTSITIGCPALAWREVHPETVDSGRRGVALHSVRFLPATR